MFSKLKKITIPKACFGVTIVTGENLVVMAISIQFF